MRSLKTYISKRIEDPNATKVRDKKALKDAQTVSQVEEAGRQWKTHWFFIEKSTWEEENPEKDPKSIKWVKEALPDYGGKEVEGIWQRKQKKGYHEVMDYTGSSARKETVIDDGKEVLDAKQQETKFGALKNAFMEQSQDVSRKALDSADLVSLIASIHSKSTAASSGSAGSNNEDMFKDGDADSNDDEDEDDSDIDMMDEDDMDRLMGKDKKTPSKAKPAASSSGHSSASAVKPVSSKASAVSSSGRKSLPARSPPPGKEQAQSRGNREVVALDGRTERLKKSLQDEITSLMNDLKPLQAFDEELESCSAENKAKMQEAMKLKIKQATAVLSKVRPGSGG